MSDPGVAPRVFVGIPAHRTGAMLRDTLASVAGQTHARARVVVALDGPDAQTEEACAEWRSDPRFTVIVHPERRGWVDNVNGLLARAEGEPVCILPHDDVLEPSFLAVLVRHLDEHPECAVAYSDVQAFGTVAARIVAPSVVGPPLARVQAMLAGSANAVPFRGLVRAEVAARAGPLPRVRTAEFGADIAWLLRLCRFGELHRVPLALYRKRYHGSNAYLQWARWTKPEAIEGWAVHCAHLLEEAAGLDLAPPFRWPIVAACAARAVAGVPPDGIPLESLAAPTADDRRALLHRFVEETAARGGGRWMTWLGATAAECLRKLEETVLADVAG